MYFKVRKYTKHEVVYWNGKRWTTKPFDLNDETWQIFDFTFDSERIKIDFVESNVLFVDGKVLRISLVWLSDGTKIMTPSTVQNVWDRWEKHLSGEEEPKE